MTLKPNYRRLGPRFGKRMPEVARAVAELAPAEAARAIDAGETVTIEVDGSAERLEADDLLREARPTEGYAVGQDARLAVGLATEITPDLRLEGLAREIVHAVQSARRTAGLRVEERILLHLDGSGLIREAAEGHRAEIAAETLATQVSISHGAPFAGIHHEEHVIDGEPLADPDRPGGGPVRRLRPAAAPGGGAGAEHDVVVGAEAAPDAVGVEAVALDDARQVQHLARVVEPQAHDLAVAGHDRDALLGAVGLHVGERLDVAEREVDGGQCRSFSVGGREVGGQGGLDLLRLHRAGEPGDGLAAREQHSVGRESTS